MHRAAVQWYAIEVTALSDLDAAGFRHCVRQGASCHNAAHEGFGKRHHHRHKALEAAISKFLEGLTVPTRATGKLARWKDGVCPLVLGVRPEVEAVLVKKIRGVAAEVGAPVNASDGCPNNIEVIFTAEPQALLDNVRIMHPNLLGYFDNSAQAEKLATMRLPIQSWYITATVDLHGQSQVDGARKGRR